MSFCGEDMRWIRVAGGKFKGLRLWRPDKGHRTLLEHFFRTIQGGEQAELGIEEGTRATVIGLRLLDALRTGRPQEI